MHAKKPNPRRMLAVALAVAVAAGTTAAWGSAAGAARGKAAAKKGALVKLRKTSLGTVLVDRRGRTLYLFEADKGKRSVCYGACAQAWPPLLTAGKPVAGAGVSAKLLGTTARKGGKRQVTYRGHPLYFFVKDTKPGQTLGEGLNGFGGSWYVLSRTGAKIEHASAGSGGSTPAPPPATTTTTTTPGAGGYGY